MAEPKPEHPPSSLSVQDVFFVVFKHKWKILLLTLAGLGAAAYVYFSQAPLYESYAKLLVRYVVDRNVVDSVDNGEGGHASASAISSEVEILTSWDLALQVAEAVGIEQLAPSSRGLHSNVTAAAQTVQKGLGVNPHGNVIVVSYKSENPALTSAVLQELVNRYFTKHLEVHRSAGAFDFVTQQADQIRGRLTQTEEELKRLKDKAGIISLPESTVAVNSEIIRIQTALSLATTERAEQIARIQEFEKMFSDKREDQAKASPTAAANPSPAARSASTAETQQYEALMIRLGQARQIELDLLAKFQPENRQVQVAHAQIEELERRRAALAAKYPELANKVATTNGGGLVTRQGPDLMLERAQLAAVEARMASLKIQLQSAQQRAEQLAAITPQITQLERQEELENNNYKYFAASLEKARVDEALDPSKIPNISVVQKPSIALRTTGDLRKTLLQLIGGGLGLGLGLAFLIEMVLDQTIKRSAEFERRLHIPLLLAIPLQKSLLASKRLRLQTHNQSETSTKAIQGVKRVPASPWETGHDIRPFAEAIRDRLGLYFELNNLTHKPKLVAVTSLSEGAGTSTIAGGIAAALSETGEGKVLLVDMNIGHPEVQPFFGGKPAFSLMTALEPGTPIAPAADNLYLATPYGASGDKQVQLGPKRLYELTPFLKASNFDYIIFDMPSLDESSVVLSMAGLMDKVLLVTEAEKSSAGVLRRAYQELVAAKGSVACVLNKTRSYGPKLIKAEA